jgi:hypothetical protein
VSHLENGHFDAPEVWKAYMNMEVKEVLVGVRMRMDEAGSGSYPLASVDIFGVEFSGSATRVLMFLNLELVFLNTYCM